MSLLSERQLGASRSHATYLKCQYDPKITGTLVRVGVTLAIVAAAVKAPPRPGKRVWIGHVIIYETLTSTSTLGILVFHKITR